MPVSTNKLDSPASNSPHQPKREAGAAKEEAQRAAGEVQDTARRVASDAQRELSHAASEASQHASEVAQRAKAEASAFAVRQKKAAAEEMGHVGEALHRAAEKLHEENDHNIADYVEAAADGTKSLAGYLDDTDYSALFRDARSFVRHHPGKSFTGLFAAGVVLSRFLKASQPEHERIGSGGSAPHHRHAGTPEPDDAGQLPGRTEDVSPPAASQVSSISQ